MPNHSNSLLVGEHTYGAVVEQVKSSSGWGVGAFTISRYPQTIGWLLHFTNSLSSVQSHRVYAIETVKHDPPTHRKFLLSSLVLIYFTTNWIYRSRNVVARIWILLQHCYVDAIALAHPPRRGSVDAVNWTCTDMDTHTRLDSNWIKLHSTQFYSD